MIIKKWLLKNNVINYFNFQQYGEFFFFACVGGLIIAFVSRAMVERVAITAHLVGCGVLSGGVYIYI